MKIAVIGGAGVRTPLLVGGLTGSDLPIDQIALYDVDRTRLAAIGAVAERMAAKGRVTLCDSVAECVAWADVVFTSIRVGGIAQRIHDEAVAQRHGIVGQETVGPAGFAAFDHARGDISDHRQTILVDVIERDLVDRQIRRGET